MLHHTARLVSRQIDAHAHALRSRANRAPLHLIKLIHAARHVPIFLILADRSNGKLNLSLRYGIGISLLHAHIGFVVSLLIELILVNRLLGRLSQECLRICVLLKCKDELIDLLCAHAYLPIRVVRLHLKQVQLFLQLDNLQVFVLN